MKRPITSARNVDFVPDISKEDQEWDRITCTCGAILAMTNGDMLRIRHRDRGHDNKVAYIYIDLTGDAPQVVAEVPATTGTGKDQHHVR